MKYSAKSAYAKTPLTKHGHLDIMRPRAFRKLADDVPFKINRIYHLRPDLLAFDLYDSSELWWVFAARNPNTLLDPLMDFREGTLIRIPKISTLREDLGF